MPTISGKSCVFFRVRYQHTRDNNRDSQESEVDDVLSLIGDGPLRQDFLQFSRGHQAARERQRAEDDFEREHAHHEARHTRRAQIKFRCADQRHAECTKRVTQRGPLRNGGHGDFAERHADDRSEHQADKDPFVFHDAVVEQCAGNRQQHAQFAGKDAAARGRRRAQPLEREDEERGGNQISDLDKGVRSEHVAHGFFGPLGLNILSIRSVMRKPPTMLLVAATMAIVPRIFASVALCAWY